MYGRGNVPSATSQSAWGHTAPFIRTWCVTWLRASVPASNRIDTLPAAVLVTARFAGAVGAVVSGVVVTVTALLGTEPLNWASQARTWNVIVWPGRSPVTVPVVCGWFTDTTPDMPSPHRT
jgi:hypothetical protein